MNIILSHKRIKEMCGTVSFKRGDYFYRSNKVMFEQYAADFCKAAVLGEEKFFVTIEAGAGGEFNASCSCPKLATFNKDCQHIAAVLIAIYDYQKKGTTPEISQPQLAQGLLNLFADKPVRTTNYQHHFENRTVMGVEFLLRLVSADNGQNLFGIELKIETVPIQDIRAFLECVREGIPDSASGFNPELHCFATEHVDVLEQLFSVIADEQLFGNRYQTKENKQMLMIPPASWWQLLSLLLKARHVSLEVGEMIHDSLEVTADILPLQFHFSKAATGSYQLKVIGFERLLLLDYYQTVLFAGKLKVLEEKDYRRLTELNQLLKTSGTNRISISQVQLPVFYEKTIQGLKQLGQVHFSEEVRSQLLSVPLRAKLFLDRVKNRLLAGLEFHYENWLINPLEGRELPAASMIIRDVDKEEAILKLMEDSAFAKTDGGYFLHNEELEYEFLYHIVPKLHKLVQIYATTAVRNRLSRESFHPRINIKVKKERMNWLEFKFSMDGINEQQIREVLAALEEKRKYYRLPNGSLLSLQSREFAEIQRFFRSGEIKSQELANGLSVPFEQCLHLLDTVEVVDVFALEKSFREFLDCLYHPEKLQFPVPDSLVAVLTEYQKHGFQWLKTLASFGFGGILADEMGLGKTIQSIAFIVSVIPEVRSEKLPVVVVTPSSLTYNWLNEFKKFTGGQLNIEVINGSKAQREKQLQTIAGVDVIIVSYPLLRKEILWFEKQSFHTVFFDEAQAFKNPLTQTARAVKKLKASHRFALTGTPVENSADELWSIFHVVFPELFRGLKDFSKLTRKQIARRIRPFVLRRLKEDVLGELPEKMELLEVVELLPEQKRLYAAYLAKLRHDTLKHLDKETIRKNRIRILAGITRLRQICCHPVLFVDGYKGSSAKFTQLLKIVEEAKQAGRRVLIFSQFTKMLELIARGLTRLGLPFFYLDGQTPAEERVETCERFNRGERDFFLISLKAGGTGLNLMGADTVVLYDTWWNPAVEAQAADRAHRMGQKNTVQVIKLITRGTIEEKMNELQTKKRHLIAEIIDSDDKMLTALTEDDIREILMG
ncbi:DEAD/DEAH box helicase [Bacillus rubiinfantis]|uniref:DEAD/DEAH box helicase n=1 Tax=Bacillus rubiinfantis TaxID=1499680 RepID=UPI0005A8E7C6|nr:DEAD/DEAH box helicase [Bacillus rubiinfantis]